MIYLSVQMFCLEASSKVCWAFVSTLHYYCDKAERKGQSRTVIIVYLAYGPGFNNLQFEFFNCWEKWSHTNLVPNKPF